MAKQISYNYTDTAINGVTTLNLARGKVNYGADFRVKSDEPGEAIITNLSSPVVYPERYRFSVTDVKNVYTGSNIEPSLYSPTKTGTSLLVQLTEVWKVTDTVDTSLEVALPVSAHIVIKVPNHELVTPAAVQTLVGRLISGLYETGSESTTRITAMLRGSLKPSDL